jgi:hypothetical protein
MAELKREEPLPRQNTIKDIPQIQHTAGENSPMSLK